MQNVHPPYWGLTLSLNTQADVLVVDDNADERYPILHPLLRECGLTWATTPDEAKAAFEKHGPYDIYLLDYDLEDTPGGWWPTAEFIRREDPHSIAKVVIVHSANPAAWVYRGLFPTALVIHWMAFATLLGTPLIEHHMIERLLKIAGPDASVAKLQATALKITNQQPSEKPNSPKSQEVSS